MWENVQWQILRQLPWLLMLENDKCTHEMIINACNDLENL